MSVIATADCLLQVRLRASTTGGIAMLQVAQQVKLCPGADIARQTTLRAALQKRVHASTAGKSRSLLVHPPACLARATKCFALMLCRTVRVPLWCFCADAM